MNHGQEQNLIYWAKQYMFGWVLMSGPMASQQPTSRCPISWSYHIGMKTDTLYFQRWCQRPVLRCHRRWLHQWLPRSPPWNPHWFVVFLISQLARWFILISFLFKCLVNYSLHGFKYLMKSLMFLLLFIFCLSFFCFDIFHD